MSHIEVTAKFNRDRIVVETTSNPEDGVRQVILRQIIDLQDVAIRKALIELGWTPPKEVAA